MNDTLRKVPWLAAAAGCLLMASPSPARASSHMDAPLITLDPSANTTDVYAFVSQDRNGSQVPDHRARGLSARGAGHRSEQVQLRRQRAVRDSRRHRRAIWRPAAPPTATSSGSRTRFKNRKHDPAVVPRRHQERGRRRAEPDADLHGHAGRITARAPVERLGDGIVPPNNQGIATPIYNQNDNGETAGEGRRRHGSRARSLHRADPSPISSDGYSAFAGQRDDGFYADIQAIFDLLKLRAPGQGFDSQGGFNVHTMALSIPLDATRRRPTGRRRLCHDQPAARDDPHARSATPILVDGFVQVGAPGQSAVQRRPRRHRGQGPLQPHEPDSRRRRCSASTRRSRSWPR